MEISSGKSERERMHGRNNLKYTRKCYASSAQIQSIPSSANPRQIQKTPPLKKKLHDTMADCVMSLGYTRASIPDSYIKWWHPLSLLRSSFPTPNIVVINSYIEAAAKLLFQFLISTICICGINLLGFPTDHYRATKWVDPLQRPTHLPLSNAAATNLPVVFPPFFPLHCSLIKPLQQRRRSWQPATISESRKQQARLPTPNNN